MKHLSIPMVMVASILTSSALADESYGIDRSAYSAPVKYKRVAKRVKQQTVIGLDANGNGVVVVSKSGVKIHVAPSAQRALQCVVDYVESHGVKIKYMRGYGPGTVRGSMHPGGRAIDINQLSRDVTSPVVPRSVSNGAADACGVISGARWGYADNGHWNLPGRVAEPWPRVLRP